MMHFLKGGNWTDGVHAGLFSFMDPWTYHEIVPPIIFDIDGLPERWVEILMGQTNWIPKIVFEINAKKKKERSF